MNEITIYQQNHGYKNGHQLLAGSVKLNQLDQDLVDRLSDIGGSLQPGEHFNPYLTGYPLPTKDFYVLARTWQDLEAPRAGCVFTRSLFIPLEWWGKLENFEPIFSLLSLDSRFKDTSPLTIETSGSSLAPPVHDSRIGELVEAIFLENRQPTVMFEVKEAEAVVRRLITALWSGFRRNFSFSTYALAPRKVSGQFFDLLFAPKTARARFSGWPGRTIDIGSTSNSPRHRWTSLIAHKIFESNNPNLLILDSLGTLQSDSDGNESALRLSLLWSELLEKSETSPTALLGMLDILNSQNKRFKFNYQKKH
jgi:hypothetical protein